MVPMYLGDQFQSIYAISFGKYLSRYLYQFFIFVSGQVICILVIGFLIVVVLWLSSLSSCLHGSPFGKYRSVSRNGSRDSGFSILEAPTP